MEYFYKFIGSTENLDLNFEYKTFWRLKNLRDKYHSFFVNFLKLFWTLIFFVYFKHCPLKKMFKFQSESFFWFLLKKEKYFVFFWNLIHITLIKSKQSIFYLSSPTKTYRSLKMYIINQKKHLQGCETK